jgi:hypothetical protein
LFVSSLIKILIHYNDKMTNDKMIVNFF